MRTEDHEWLGKLKGRYQGERLFVLGTGPSLRHHIGAAVNKLPWKDEITWGVNLLAHCITGDDAFIDFLPGWWSASEIDHLRNIDMSLAGLQVTKILACHFDPDYPTPGLYPDWHWVWAPEYRDMATGYFSGFEDEVYWLADGHSVVFTSAVQLAAWMGFDTVYLLGCETTIHGHAYADIYEPPARDRERQGQVQAAATVARRYYEKHARKLIDLSGPTGTLPLEKGDFHKLW